MIKDKRRARVIAFYLPQYYPTPENDEWWGKGFTEWRNVTSAKPLFPNHKQPNLPGELGFYDLRVPETRQQQAELARQYGIEGFCYWHYWFGNGRRILDRPFKEVVESGEPDFPFCLCWCNISWGGKPYGDLYNRLLMEQKYPGKQDIDDHFYALLPAFQDARYIKVHGKNLFTIYNPTELPQARSFMDRWNELAVHEGLEGFHFVAYAHEDFDYRKDGYDAITFPSPSYFLKREGGKIRTRLVHAAQRRLKLPKTYRYLELVAYADYNEELNALHHYPNIFPNWDHTPRSKNMGTVCTGSTPTQFSRMIGKAVNVVIPRPLEERIIFIKAWNEWAEGNYLEPDQVHGRAYLEAIAENI